MRGVGVLWRRWSSCGVACWRTIGLAGSRWELEMMTEVKGRWDGQSERMRERRVSMEASIAAGEASGMGMQCGSREGREYAERV